MRLAPRIGTTVIEAIVTSVTAMAVIVIVTAIDDTGIGAEIG